MGLLGTRCEGINPWSNANSAMELIGLTWNSQELLRMTRTSWEFLGITRTTTIFTNKFIMIVL